VRRPELSLVFPVFDEAENIDELVETALDGSGPMDHGPAAKRLTQRPQKGARINLRCPSPIRRQQAARLKEVQPFGGTTPRRLPPQGVEALLLRSRAGKLFACAFNNRFVSTFLGTGSHHRT